MDKNLIGACGLYCGGCKNYDGGKEICGGCGSDKLTEWCSKCLMRLCSVERGYTSCVECYEYPCKNYNDFFEDGKKWEEAKHRNDIVKNLKYLKEAGNEGWLAFQKERWQCKCGNSYKYYDKKCNSCGENTYSYKNVEYISTKDVNYEFDNKGEKYIFRGVKNTDSNKLGEYFEGLSLESKKRFGPHPLNKDYAEYLCKNSDNDYFIARFIVEGLDTHSIVGYFILDFNLSPHELKRYSEFKTDIDKNGIKLHPFNDILFAPSIADQLQNSGIASRVMPIIIDFSKDKKAKSIVLMGGTQETNHRAIRYYEKFGFEKVGGYNTEIYNYDMRLILAE